MEKKIIHNLGKPFNTLNADNMNKEGIGLGLYICNMIISQLGP
jgi:K+-sensing histidine kinase KdpD